MKKHLIPAVLLAVCLPAFAQVVPENSQIAAILKNTSELKDSITVPKFLASTLTDAGFGSMEFSCETVRSVERPRKYKPFNPKKDDINKVVIVNHGGYSNEICVLHKNGKCCDMNEFRIRVEGNNLVCKELVGQHKYVIEGTIWDYMDGTYPMEGTIHITHITTGLSTFFTYKYVLEDSFSYPGRNNAMLISPVPSNVKQGYYSVINLTTGFIKVFKGHVVLDARGKNGRNGRNGSWGLNGRNAYTWTDKNGKSHYVSGTLGMPGGDGGNGEDGGNGGNLFVFVDPAVPGSTVTVKYAGGKGGKGGSGGLGGVHGKGSGLSGRARNGRPGLPGKDGADGSVQFYNMPWAVADIYKQLLKDASVKPSYPYIIVDSSEKLKKKASNNKVKKTQAQDAGAVAF